MVEWGTGIDSTLMHDWNSVLHLTSVDSRSRIGHLTARVVRIRLQFYFGRWASILVKIPENLSILLFVSELETKGLRICSFNLKGFFSYSPDAGDFDCQFSCLYIVLFYKSWSRKKKKKKFFSDFFSEVEIPSAEISVENENGKFLQKGGKLEAQEICFYIHLILNFLFIPCHQYFCKSLTMTWWSF